LTTPLQILCFRPMSQGARLIRIITTTSTKEEAERIASILVEERLAACCQVSGPILSVYPWKGKVERDEEWVLSIKTLEGKYRECEEAIKRVHSYELPQIIAFPVEMALEPYGEWVRTWVEEGR